jgi:hypothetical protein
MPIYSLSEVTAEGRKALAGGFINPAGVIAWLLQLAVFTIPGVIVSSIAIAIYLLPHFPERPWLALAAPIYLLPLAFLAFMFLSAFTDLATQWVFERTFGKPNPEKMSHRIAYFLVSIPIWALLALLFGSGGDGICSGPARYCG